MNTFKSISDLIKKTQLLQLSKFTDSEEIVARALAKLEFFNPSGSEKDRIAKAEH